MDGAGRDQPLHLPDLAASGAGDHGGHPDPDDLPAVGLRRNPRHHQWRPGLRIAPTSPSSIYDQALLQFDVGAAPRRAVSSRSSSPTSSAILPDAHDRQERWTEPEDRHGTQQSPPGAKLHARTVVAWTIAILIFFPILWTFLTSFKTEAAGDRLAAGRSSSRLDDRRTTCEVQERSRITSSTSPGIRWSISFGSTTARPADRDPVGLVDGVLRRRSAPRTC